MAKIVDMSVLPYRCLKNMYWITMTNNNRGRFCATKIWRQRTVRDHWKSRGFYAAFSWFVVIPLSEIILYKYFVFINCFFDVFLLSEEDTILAILFKFTAIAVSLAWSDTLLSPYPLARAKPWKRFISAFFLSMPARSLYFSRNSSVFSNCEHS